MSYAEIAGAASLSGEQVSTSELDEALCNAMILAEYEALYYAQKAEEFRARAEETERAVRSLYRWQK